MPHATSFSVSPRLRGSVSPLSPWERARVRALHSLALWERVGVRVLIFCAAILATTAACFAEPLPEEVQESLKAKWAKQRSEIQSAKIEYRLVFPLTNNRLSPEAVLKLVNASDVAPGDLEGFRRFAAPFLTSPSPTLAEGVGASRFVKSGMHKKDEGMSMTIINEPEHQVIASPRNGQVDIFAPHGAHVASTGLGDFRLVPQDGLASGNAQRAEGLIRFASNSDSHTQIIVEESTGLLRMRSYLDGQGLLRQKFQIGTVEYPGDLIFPAITLNCIFRNGALVNIRIFFIERTEFNVDVDESEFAVAGFTKGTNVFDYRQSKKSRYLRIAAPTNNVVGYVEKSTKIGATRSWSWIVPLALLIILLISVAGIWAWSQGRLPRAFYKFY